MDLQDTRWRLVVVAGVLSLLAVMISADVRSSYAQTADFYAEDFDDGEAQGWALDPQVWFIEEGALYGKEAGRAVYEPGAWSSLAWTFQLRQLGGVLAANFHLAGDSRYVVFISYELPRAFAVEQSYTIDVTLDKQLGPDQYTGVLAEGSFEPGQYTPESPEQGLSVEVLMEGGLIVVSLGGQPVLRYRDPEPLPGGTIAFEAFEGSAVAVDNLVVQGVPMAAPGQDEQPLTPDLAVLSAKPVEFIDEGRAIRISVEVANLSEVKSPPAELRVEVESDPYIAALALIGDLGPDERRTEEIVLELPKSLGGTEQVFIVWINSSAQVPERDMQNNRLATPPVAIPVVSGSAQPVERELPSWLVLGAVLGVLGLAAVGAAALTISRAIRLRQRRQWEQKAKQGRPPQSCQSSQYYCEVETEVELKRLKVTSLTLAALDPGSRQPSRTQEIKGRLAGLLDHAVRARLLGERPEKLAERVNPLARELSEVVAQFARREGAPRDLTLTAHLEGIEMKATFTLYRCVNHAWKQVAQWEKKQQVERDDLALTLTSLDPADPELARWLPPALVGPLMQFVEGYRPV